MTGKGKKKVDFTVRPKATKEELPPTPEQWVKGGEATAEEGAAAPPQLKEKRLTLNLPTDLHTAFKARCVFRGTTIQDRVTMLIQRDLTEETASDKPSQG
jgi:hypothetical protein